MTSFPQRAAVKRLVSVLTPAYDEADNLPALYEKLLALRQSLKTFEADMEWVVIDDHSRDATPCIVRRIAQSDTGVRLIRLSRNCGSHAAVAAGLAHCRGQCAAIVAADLQDPPELLLDMFQKWAEGAHVVWAVREKREGIAWTARLASDMYYRIMRAVALKDMPATGADFLLVDRMVIDAYNQIKEKHSSLFALIQWMGFKQTCVRYVKKPRRAGKSKWTLRKKIKLFVDSIVSFSSFPIRAITIVGVAFLAVAFLFPVVAAIMAMQQWFNFGVQWTLVISILLLGNGATLIALGILGEYLWRAYDEVRGRPKYLIEYMFPACEKGVAIADTSTNSNTSADPIVPLFRPYEKVPQENRSD